MNVMNDKSTRQERHEQNEWDKSNTSATQVQYKYDMITTQVRHERHGSYTSEKKMILITALGKTYFLFLKDSFSFSKKIS